MLVRTHTDINDFFLVLLLFLLCVVSLAIVFIYKQMKL